MKPGAGGAGLRVDDMDITTGSVAAGLRLKGVLGSNLTGRDITGEFRVLVSQDFGEDKAQANVAYLANPGLVPDPSGEPSSAAPASSWAQASAFPAPTTAPFMWTAMRISAPETPPSAEPSATVTTSDPAQA